MSILGKYTDNLIEEEQTNAYTTPAVLREDKDELTLKKSIVISTILHPSVLGAAWLAFLILAFFGINFALFERPKPKMNDNARSSTGNDSARVDSLSRPKYQE